MTQGEKLQKIIEHAHKNRPDLIQEGCIDSAFDDNKEWMKVIFSIKFLKAFFGEEIKCEHYKQIHNCEGCNSRYDFECSAKSPKWEYYAKKLVVLSEEKRIDYLYEFIKDK